MVELGVCMCNQGFLRHLEGYSHKGYSPFFLHRNAGAQSVCQITKTLAKRRKLFPAKKKSAKVAGTQCCCNYGTNKINEKMPPVL